VVSHYEVQNVGDRDDDLSVFACFVSLLATFRPDVSYEVVILDMDLFPTTDVVTGLLSPSQSTFLGNCGNIQRETTMINKK
jgi:hypothetical protein